MDELLPQHKYLIYVSRYQVGKGLVSLTNCQRFPPTYITMEENLKVRTSPMRKVKLIFCGSFRSTQASTRSILVHKAFYTRQY